jgi:hypothetical protein
MNAQEYENCPDNDERDQYYCEHIHLLPLNIGNLFLKTVLQILKMKLTVKSPQDEKQAVLLVFVFAS